MQVAQVLAESGAKVEVMTPDRTFAPEVFGMNLVPYMRALQDKDVTFTVTYRLTSVARAGNQIEATIDSDYRPVGRKALFDQVVVNHGTAPLDQLYFDLKPLSGNKGAVDYEALIAAAPQPSTPGFQLYRIGDAIESRNIHAAIYDALRLMLAV